MHPITSLCTALSLSVLLPWQGSQRIRPAPSGVPKQVVAAPHRPVGHARLDLATGTLSREPITRVGSADTVVSFPNLDLSGYSGVDAGGGTCEWIDAGTKSAGASALMVTFTVAYCSSALDPSLGGPGGQIELSFWEGYSQGGNGVGPNGTEVARIALGGLPAHTLASSFLDGRYSCYFLEVTLPATLCFADGPIGYGWKFVDLGTDGTYAATFPLLACVEACDGPGPDAQGMTNVLDEYCPPGVLASSFTFDTAVAGFTTSVAMEMTEQVPALPRPPAPEKGELHAELSCYKTQNEGEKTNLGDDELAKALQGKLGNTHKGLILVIDSCYSNSFLIEIGKAFKNCTMAVYGTAAGDWFQKSDLYVNEKGGKVAGLADWGGAWPAYHPGIEQGMNKNEKEGVILAKYARARVTELDKCMGFRQILGSGAGKYVALLVAGSSEPTAEKERKTNAALWNTTDRVRSALIKSGYPAAKIQVLFSDGQGPDNAVTAANAFPINGAATRKKILDAIQGLEVDADTQVFVYLGLHGVRPAKRQSRLVRPAAVELCANVLDFGMPSSDDLLALMDEDNLTGPILELRATALFSGVLPPGYRISFNGVEIDGGTGLPHGSATAELLLPVDPGLVSTSGNQAWIWNSDPGAPPIAVQGLFSVGEISMRQREGERPPPVRHP